MDPKFTYVAKFFDGLSAAVQPASVALSSAGVHVETAEVVHDWMWPTISLSHTSDGEYRLTSSEAPDALVILPHDARLALEQFAPDLISGRRERRKFTALVVGLILGAGLITATIFFGVPAASGPLARATPPSIEQQIGENIAAQTGLILRRCVSQADAVALVQPVLDEMAAAGDVGFDIDFAFVRPRMPNAFALPGGHVRATAGLLTAVGDDQEAFWAVMAHELGHVRARDSMQAVYRNAGLSTVLEIITGGSGVAQQAILIGGQLNELSHTRRQETAADEAAYELLEKMEMNPAALARAFEAIVGQTSDDRGEDDANKREQGPRDRIASWLDTHPDIDQRIALARERELPTKRLPLTKEDWAVVQDACAQAED
ncbi:MAG: M48 family metallopeptidase [Pseudomonadota bacterium]